MAGPEGVVAVDLLPQSRQVLVELSQASGVDLLAPLQELSAGLERLVPSCVGFSLSGVGEEFTFTMVATDELVAALDATQYLDSGPCLDAVQVDAVVVTGDLTSPLDEGRWALFARASAAHGVRSTWSVPLRERGRVVGSVNVYAGDAEAFAGRDDELAALFGGWAPDAVRNADLAWATRASSGRMPERLRDRDTEQQASGVLMAEYGLDAGSALARLRAAAVRADVESVVIARVVIALAASRRR